MKLPKTFIGLSGTDLGYYQQMLTWKEHDFNFTSCKLPQEIRADNESYIRGRCRERLENGSTFTPF